MFEKAEAEYGDLKKKREIILKDKEKVSLSHTMCSAFLVRGACLPSFFTPKAHKSMKFNGIPIAHLERYRRATLFTLPSYVCARC